MFNPKKGGVSSLGKIKYSFASWEQKTQKEVLFNPSEEDKDVEGEGKQKREVMLCLENFS